MPGGDGTGPGGMGSMTGRGAGYCAGNTVPGYMNSYGGRNFGAGRGVVGARGRGRGYRNQYYATGLPGNSPQTKKPPHTKYSLGSPTYGSPYIPDVDPKEEVKMLKDQAGMLEKQLDDIQGRMDELKKGPDKKEK